MAEKGRITVFAGVNGAGKSSVVGEYLRSRGGDYFNPDEATARFLTEDPWMSGAAANARAWEEGRKRLEEAIRGHADFTFETTLGGATITRLVMQALDEGLEVAMVYVGLESVERHLDRIRSRVAGGGHDIPEKKVRARCVSSLQNLVKLAPRLTELRVFDNSAEADPKKGRSPEPMELLYASAGELVRHCEFTACPTWAKPVFMVLLKR